MSRAGNWSENLKENSRNSIGITYIVCGVGLECAVINLEIPVIDANGTALEVACGPPGHGRKLRKILETGTLPLTKLAELLVKMLV
jgi:hypothetical protein